MSHPTSLYRFETDGPGPLPQPGVLLVLLGAFVDAGNIQRTLAAHLLAGDSPKVVASFDVDSLLDYRSRRPAMVFDTNRWESYDDPAILLYRLTDREGQTYYLLTGPEPDYQWERFIEALRELIATLGITLTASAHGIPMGVPHTRPVGMTAHATDPRLIGHSESPFGRVQVPASIGALLELRLGESGRDGLGLAIHVPHYLTQAEWAEGALAALNAIVDLTGLNLPNDELVTKAGVNTREIARELADNPEAGQLVAALEQQYDAFMKGRTRPSLLATEAGELPSADQLGAEFEEFLRNRPTP
ncbi:MAG TPA: PAC2 family protein [Phycicoccus sp.]|nr:PAC2 family protein [Phycicoccus sp.]